MYVALLGKSGKTKKTTTQYDIIGDLYPSGYRGPANFSPEGLLQLLGGREAIGGNNPKPAIAPRPQMICTLGEFSIILRSIKNGGNMGNFKEIANDLFTRKDAYDKQLVEKVYHVDYPYLSLSTTCTEEEFFGNLTPDMVHGGFLPRWLLVYSEPPVRRKIELPSDIDTVEYEMKSIVKILYEIFKKREQLFVFDEGADKLMYEIQCELEDDGKWENVQPFVSRYMSYIVKYADILCISEKLAGLTHLTELTQLTSLSSLTSVIYDIRVKLASLLTNVSCGNSVNSVNSEHINRSKSLILPCLEYARKVVSYVDEEHDLATVLRVIDGKQEIDRSSLLQRSHLSSVKLDIVLRTLLERGEYEQVLVDVGKGKHKTVIRKCGGIVNE